MKKILLTVVLVTCFSTGISSGQSFDWNLRGGLNMMRSSSTDEVSYLYHLGAQAGVRIAHFGFYGEALYSMNANQYDGDPIPYFIPAVIVKGFWRKSLFVEFGGSYLSMIGESGVKNDSLNPDGKLAMVAGLGVHFSKIEISMRVNTIQPNPILQLTAAVKF
jgi:hypothetical protein